MQYTETQLAKLIEDVEKEFTAHLAKAEDTSAQPEADESAVLAKAEEGDKKPSEEKPEEKDSEKEGEKPAAEAEKAPAAEAKPAAEAEKAPAAEAKPEAEGEAKPEGEHGHGEHDYDAEDMEHLSKMYSSMSKGELMVHHDACKNALDKCMAKCGDMSQEKPAMAKSEEIKVAEVVVEETKPSQEVELLKSELGAQSAKYEELKKNFDAVAAFLTKLVEKKPAPAAKAITNLDTIAKSEGNGEDEKTLTKSEIDSTLNKKAQDPSLKKSDRDAINAYYLEGGSIQSISHLLK